MTDILSIYNCGFNKHLGLRVVEVCKTRAVVELEIKPEHLQPHGFVHGGVTLALLETAASAATCANADLETEYPFGVGINVKHKKPGVEGVLRASAELESESISEYSGALKQTWRICATDMAGDVISEGTFESKIVSKEYLARRHKGYS